MLEFVEISLVTAAAVAISFTRVMSVSTKAIECKQDLGELPPKDGLISAEPVKRISGRFGKTQEAARKVCTWIMELADGAGRGLVFVS